MHTSKAIFWVIAAGVLTAGMWQWRAGVALRGELAVLHSRAAERGALEVERARLVAAGVSPEERQALEEERAAVAHLRSEIEQLRRGAEARAQTAAVKAPQIMAEREMSMAAEFVPFGAWKNRGRATPADAMETALWAAAGGDLVTLAGAIHLDPPVRAQAQQLLGRLPPEVAAQFGTAEDFIALLAAKDVPLAQAHLIEPQVTLPEGIAMRVVQLRESSGKMRLAALQLSKQADGEWRINVPAAALAKYAAELQGAAPEGKK